MSYPPLSNYDSYYGTNSQQPSAYSSNRPPQGNAYALVTFPGDRQPQYSTSSYDWQGQGQQGYGQNAQQSYGGDSYGQGGQYDYRRDAANYGTQAAAGTNGPYDSSKSAGRAQNLQGLDSLAYASGIDPQRNQQNNTTGTSYNGLTATSINRVQSPMQAPTAQRQYSTNPPAYNTTPANKNSPAQMSAAAQALAGAVSRKNQQNANSARGAPPPSASPYTAPQSQHQRTQSQSQTQAPARSPNVSIQRAPAPRSTAAQRKPSNSSSQPTSISNLVT